MTLTIYFDSIWMRTSQYTALRISFPVLKEE